MNQHRAINTSYRFLLMGMAILVFSKIGYAIDRPVLNCVEVDPIDGHAILTWQNDPDPEIAYYEIYSNADFFALPIATVAVGLNTYEDFSINALTNSTQTCYSIIAYNAEGSVFSEESEVTCNVFISQVDGVVESTSPPGYAEVTIRGPFDFWVNPPTQNYELYLSKDGGTFENVSYITINEGVLHYEVVDCESQYDFYATLEGTNCSSNIVGHLFHDINLPPTPFITSVAVDSTDSDLPIVLSWTMPNIEQEPSVANIWGYIIYQCDPDNPNVGTPLDTIFSSSQNSYIVDASLIPAQAAVQYQLGFSVAAFDYCMDGNNFSNLGSTSCNSTLYLTPPQFDCDFVILKWLPYEGWNSTSWYNSQGVEGYEILIKQDNQPTISLGEAGMDNFDGEYFVDTIYDVNFGTSSTFYINAYTNNYQYTALSNPQVLNLSSFEPPEKTYLGTASVLSSKEIKIVIKTDTTIRDHNYIIQKKQEESDVYQDIAEIVNSSNTLLEYIDTEVETNKFTYQYRVVVLNSCGDTVKISNAARTMMARVVNNNENFSNTISWTSYNKFELPVDQYTIYRSTTRGDLGVELATVSETTGSYTDILDESVMNTSGFFCYTILATEEPGNIHNYQGESFSNQSCSQFEPIIFIPSAFMVGGFNPIFKPVISLADYSNYRMQIYSRSGNLIFESTDYEIGWSGKYLGNEIADGSYIYIIRVKDGQGKLYEKNGMVFKLSD